MQEKRLLINRNANLVTSLPNANLKLNVYEIKAHYDFRTVST